MLNGYENKIQNQSSLFSDENHKVSYLMQDKNQPNWLNNEKLSNNFWSTSGMMTPFYELLNTMSNWLVKHGVKRDRAQKYITSLFVALSEDAVVNSNKDLKYLVKEKGRIHV